VQQKLRHLHTLKLDDPVHFWDMMDTTPRDAVDRFGNLPRPTDHSDAALISLPIETGGLGILSYKKISSNSCAAASEVAGSCYLCPSPYLKLSRPGPNLTLNTNAARRCLSRTGGDRWALSLQDS
jgi:hypothetical protein